MFEQAVFAGGGHRCWWQAGFWETIREPLQLRPKRIAGTSAGAATACLVYATTAREALAYYEPVIAATRKNAHWGKLFSRGEKVFPHEAIYRKALGQLLGGERFKELMWAAPELLVTCAKRPAGLPAGLATLTGISAYQLERRLLRPVHPKWGRKLGFEPVVKRIQDCANENSLVDLLIASSATPPFTNAQSLDGVDVLDGGLVDNVPLHALDEELSTLVLLSRPYPRHAPMFAKGHAVYVQPSKKVAASQWDYTNHAALVSTYEQGVSDAKAFLQGFRASV